MSLIFVCNFVFGGISPSGKLGSYFNFPFLNKNSLYFETLIITIHRCYFFILVLFKKLIKSFQLVKQTEPKFHNFLAPKKKQKQLLHVETVFCVLLLFEKLFTFLLRLEIYWMLQEQHFVHWLWNKK